MEYDRNSSRSSPKQKFRSSIGFSCCFRGAGDSDRERPESPIRSSSTWLRSKAQELPVVKERCLSLVSRIGRHRGHNSGVFRYDPLSYALNFDDGADDDDSLADEYRNFSSRLPVSPLPSLPPHSAVGVACS